MALILVATTSVQISSRLIPFGFNFCDNLILEIDVEIVLKGFDLVFKIDKIASMPHMMLILVAMTLLNLLLIMENIYGALYSFLMMFFSRMDNRVPVRDSNRRSIDKDGDVVTFENLGGNSWRFYDNSNSLL